MALVPSNTVVDKNDFVQYSKDGGKNKERYIADREKGNKQKAGK